jgi:tellurite resistance protein TehA-like permease
MRSLTKRIAFFAASAALVASSTAAVAATPAPQAATPNSWMMLSMLSPSGSLALGGANAAVQPADVPPPPPPAAEAGGGSGVPPLPVIGIWLAVIGVDIWILTRDHNPRVPNSPA